MKVGQEVDLQTEVIEKIGIYFRIRLSGALHNIHTQFYTEQELRGSVVDEIDGSIEVGQFVLKFVVVQIDEEAMDDLTHRIRVKNAVQAESFWVTTEEVTKAIVEDG